MAGPLSGIRVVDLSQIVSGPMAAAILAEQGAEVIKVESPGGDPVRVLGPRKGDLSAMFIAVNRGKRGLCIDLKSPAGDAALAALVARADVLIENFRPGTLDRLGFPYERCAALNPALVFASITGFGPDGPYSNIRVYDPVIQAISGLAASQTDLKGAPSLVRSLIADKTTALTAAQAITAALFHRERTGQGQRLDIAMLDATVAFNWPDVMYNHGFLDDPPAPQPEYGDLGRLWAAADGMTAVGFMQGAEFTAMMRAVGLDDLAGDPRLKDVAGRMALRAEWAPRLAEALAATRLDDLMTAFIREGAVGGRVNSRAEVVTDPQVVHNDLIVEVDHGRHGRVRGVRPAARFAGTPARVAGPAPRLGQHNAEILAELGLGDEAS
ncbi:hypothetical protein IP88_14380 [alpha proteobacterium AAP81b]|nr:hypothetical protein IP88_14380 [alpha proteobacterium AAP81b]